MENMRPKLESIQGSADWLIKQNDNAIEDHDVVSEVIRDKVKETYQPFNDLTEKVIEKKEELTITYVRCLDFDELHRELSAQLSEIATRTVSLKPLSVQPHILREQNDEVSSLENEASLLDQLCKRVVTEGKKKTKTAHGKKKDDVEAKIKEVVDRKDRVDKLLKERRNEIETLQPVVKIFDETAKRIQPLVLQSEEIFSSLRDVPTDESRCEQQQVQMKVTYAIEYKHS